MRPSRTEGLKRLITATASKFYYSQLVRAAGRQCRIPAGVGRCAQRSAEPALRLLEIFADLPGHAKVVLRPADVCAGARLHLQSGAEQSVGLGRLARKSQQPPDFHLSLHCAYLISLDQGVPLLSLPVVDLLEAVAH